MLLTDQAAHSLSRCRVCGSAAITDRGSVEFHFGYDWPIYDCNVCGCRFTLHDSSAYELLYAEAGSCYNRYIGLAEATQAAFDRDDLPGLRAALAKASKYTRVIDQLAAMPRSARLLEIGCSRGHLTSYFILDKRPVTGVDVSPTAVAAAKAAFGDHFLIAGDPRAAAGAPYDVIYHVGTIGCVADPIGMTHDLLEILPRGGRLFFNAPNRDSCAMRDQLWFDSAPPPDVVTLYRPGFWQEQFSSVAEVLETIEYEGPTQNLLIGMQTWMRRWKAPSPIALNQSKQMSAPPLARSDRIWRNVERAARRLSPWIGPFAPRCPAEFGLWVSMIKR